MEPAVTFPVSVSAGLSFFSSFFLLLIFVDVVVVVVVVDTMSFEYHRASSVI